MSAEVGHRAGGAAVDVAGLTVELGSSRVIDGIDLSLAAGSWTTVVGPNGAGKSTLLRAIAGLVPIGGNVRIDGADPRGRARAQVVAYLPQKPTLPPDMRVVDYVLLGRTPHIGTFGAPGASDRQIVGEVVERLDLAHLAHRPMASLSGGEAQRAALARALSQKAPLLLLDEPTAALDLGHGQAVLELVREAHSASGTTIVMTIHDLTIAGRYGDELVLLNGGSVAARGSRTDVLTAETLERHYGARVRIFHDESGPIVVPLPAGAEP